MKLVAPTAGLVIEEDTQFAPGHYYVDNPMLVAEDGISIDGTGAVIAGPGDGACIQVDGKRDVTIRDVNLLGFRHGIRAEKCEGLIIQRCRIRDTVEVEANTVFLDIWLPVETAYGGAVLLSRCRDTIVEDCDLQHQQSGLLAYGCERLDVRRNNASYSSGFGFYLNGTCDSVFEHNVADYCCRFEPREGGRFFGHMGADAAGFVIVNGSSRNQFLRNAARMGGDGFFAAGLGPSGIPCGCDDNLFEENDGSLSPNIAFEATFCRGNVFRNNYADRSNYGFWLGFSWDTRIEGNRLVMNRQAGVAVENGHGFIVRGNTFDQNGHGVLIWTKQAPDLSRQYPENVTSFDWQIERNTFRRNGKAVRIAADQDHGIRPMPEDRTGNPSQRPCRHTIENNELHDNRVGIDLHRADRTTIQDNMMSRNVEANLRQEDCSDTVFRNNLGAAGGYL